MKSSINERVAKLAEATSESLNKFSAKINASQPTISAIVNGETKPSFGLLEKIFETYPQLSAEWMMRGDGKMFLGEPDDQIAELEKRHNEEIERLNTIISNLSSTINKLKNQK